MNARISEWMNEWMNPLTYHISPLVILSLPSTPPPDSSPGDSGHSTEKGGCRGSVRRLLWCPDGKKAEVGMMAEMEQRGQAAKLFRKENRQYVLKTGLGDEGEQPPRMTSGFLDYESGWTAIPFWINGKKVQLGISPWVRYLGVLLKYPHSWWD